MNCAMCGKTGRLLNTIVEGTELKVCESCSRFGKVLNPVPPEKTIKQIAKESKQTNAHFDQPEKIELVVEDYPAVIRNKRERMGLKQSEFAKMVNEKESVIQNLEQGKMTPSLSLAKKLERYLKVRLIEQYEEKKPKISSSKDEDLTLGDIIKIKKR